MTALSGEPGPLPPLSSGRLAVVALVGAALCGYPLAFPAVLEPRHGVLVKVLTTALLLLTALGLRKWQASLPVGLVVCVDVVWVSQRAAYADPDLFSSTIWLLPGAVVAGAVLPARWLALKMLVLGPLVVLALRPTVAPDKLIATALVTTFVVNLISYAAYSARRRGMEMLQELERISAQDPLTGLGNRRLLDRQADLLVADAQAAGRGLTAVVVDLDHFKRVNDDRGHAAGDRVLREAATRLTSVLGEHDIAVRLGGEEFVVLAPVAGAADGERLAYHIHDAVSSPGLTCSVGVATRQLPPGVPPVSAVWQLISCADTAMYVAKTRGRDQVVTHSGPCELTTPDPRTAGPRGLPAQVPDGVIGCPTPRHDHPVLRHDPDPLAPNRLIATVCLSAAFLVGLLQLDPVLFDGPIGRLLSAGVVTCLALAGLGLVAARDARPLSAWVLPGGLLLWCVHQQALAPGHPLRLSAIALTPVVASAGYLYPPKRLAVMTVLLVPALALGLDVGAGAVIYTLGALAFLTMLIVFLREWITTLTGRVYALSVTDPLTGLANRRHLADHAVAMADLVRQRGEQLAALVIDLDHFKEINDRYGHAVGDAVLRQVARALIPLLGEHDALARLGGEELVLLAVVAEPRGATLLAERARAAITGAGERSLVTGSVGVAVVEATRLPQQRAEVVDAVFRLMAEADAAMYAAKRLGRDQVFEAGAVR